MKKLLCLFLIFACFLGAAGCQKPQQAPPDQPVHFFYLRSGQYPFGNTNSVITHEVRSGAGLVHDSQLLLSAYLQGPKSEGLKNPFPQGVRLLELTLNKTTVYITLSDEFASLAGLELTLACACLTKTATQLLSAERVIMKAETLPLAGKAQITMTPENLLLLDDSATSAKKP